MQSKIIEDVFQVDLPNPQAEEICLWLDDIRLPPIGWIWAKTAAEAIVVLSAKRVVECSLDHDLAAEHYKDVNGYSEAAYSADSSEPTGYSVVLWMAEHNVWPNIVRIHSMNPVGAKAMSQIIQRWRPENLHPKIVFEDHCKYEPDERDRKNLIEQCKT